MAGSAADLCRKRAKQINTKTMQMAKGMSTMPASNWQWSADDARIEVDDCVCLLPSTDSLHSDCDRWHSSSEPPAPSSATAAKVQLNIWSRQSNRAAPPISSLPELITDLCRQGVQWEKSGQLLNPKIAPNSNQLWPLSRSALRSKQRL